MRRLALLVLAVLFVAPIATGGAASFAAAQNGTATSTPTATPNGTPTASPTPTATPTPTPTPQLSEAERNARIAELSDQQSSPYDYTWLSSPGDVASSEHPSLRTLPEPPRAFVQVMYQDPTLIDAIAGGEPAWQSLERNTVVRENEVQLRAATEGSYRLHIVYWEQNQTRVNDSVITRPVPYAFNQTVEERTITFAGDELFETANVSLSPHFDRTVRVTMWLEQDGDPVAKWVFRHRSNPQSQAVAIDSLVGAWGFAFRNALGPGLGFGLAGLVGARLTLRRVGRGPGYGVGAWVILAGLLAMFTLPTAGFYYQVAVVLQNLPWLMGAVIGVMTFAVGLTFHEPVRTVAFLRRELHDSRTVGRRLDQLSDGLENAAPDLGPAGDLFGDGPTADGGMMSLQKELGGAGDLFDELTDAFFSDMPEVPVVKTGDAYRVPVAGLRPFIARYFARAAEFDPSEIGTREIVREGRLDDIIHVDPGVDDALTHKPARLVLALPWTVMKREYADREEDPTTMRQLIAGFLTALIVAGPAVGGWTLFNSLWNIGPVGFVVGLFVTAVLAYTAEDGWIEFDPAPVHYRAAEQHLTGLRRAWKEASERQSDREQRREVEAMTVREAREDREAEDQTFLDVMYEDKQPPKEGDDG